MKAIISSIFKTFFLSLCVIANTHFAYAQSASILPPAKTQLFDNNGNPLVGGKVDYYVPGTTTRKTTWQDAGQTVPNTNPVILDGAGRALMLGSGSYRQVVKDKNNNLIWDATTSSTGSGGGGTTATVGDGQPVGSVQTWAGFVAPSQYAFAYGQEFVRASFPELFAALTLNQNVTCTTGSPVLTSVSNTQQLSVGAKIESTCLNSGATVVSTTSSTVTASSNAIISTTSTARFFPWGNGDSALTFNAPDLRGRYLPGRDNMGGIAANRITAPYYGQSAGAIGATGGGESRVLSTSNLPPYTPSGSIAAITVTSNTNDYTRPTGGLTGWNGNGQGAGSFYVFNGLPTIQGVTSTGTTTFTGSAQGGTSTPISVNPPSVTMNYVIKITPDTNPNSYFGVASIGGMTGVLLCGTGVECSGGVISAVPGSYTLPVPTSVSLGGVFQNAISPNHFLIGLDNSGNFLSSQPSFSDLIGSISNSQIASASIDNAKLYNMAAATIKGNPTNSSSVVQDFTISGLAQLTSPNASNDMLLVWDSVANQLKKINPATIASSSIAGVSAINGSTGFITTSNGVTTSGNDLRTTFTQTGTGAVAQTLVDKSQQIINVLDFMTSAQRTSVQSFGCDPVTAEVTTSLQNAHNAAGQYGHLVYPAGCYVVSSTIYGRYGQWMEGAGDNSTHIARTGNYGNTFQFGGGAPAADASGGSIHVEGFWMTHGQPYTPGVTRINYNSNTIGSVVLATTSGLNSNVYSNGAAGVGAQIIATANGVAVVDGVTLVAGMRILVKNEGVAYKNGVYLVTFPGDASNPYTLTRVVDFDQSSEMTAGSNMQILQGNTYGGKPPLSLVFDVTTVGTTPVVFGFSDTTVATTSGLNSNSYVNGTGGIGAQLIATANGPLLVDGVFVAVGDTVLVKDEGIAYKNGVYYVTFPGDASNPYTLTRIGNFDQPSEMVATAYTTPLSGSTNGSKTFQLTNTVTTVGTSSVVFNGLTMDNLATSGAHIATYYSQGAIIENNWLWRLPYQIYAPGMTVSTIQNNAFTGNFDTVNSGVQEGIAHVSLGSVIAGPNPAILSIMNNRFFGSATPARNTTYTSTTGNVTLYGVNTNPSKYAIDTQGCEDCNIGPGNYFGGPSVAGIHFGSIDSTHTGPTLDLRIHNNFFDGGTGVDIAFDTQTVNSVTGATISNNTFNGGGIAKHSITAAAVSGTTTVLGLTVTGNSFYYQRGTPIYLAGAQYFTVSGNSLMGYNYSNISPTDPAYTGGVYVFGSSANGLVTSNGFCGNSSYTYDGPLVLSSLVNVVATENQDNGCTRFYGGVAGGSWKTFTPTVGFTGGTGTSSAGSTGAYRMESDKTMCVRATIIPTYATAPTNIYLVLPNSANSKALQIAAGRNDSVGTQLQGIANVSSPNMGIYRYDGAAPYNASGNTLALGPICMELQ